MSRPPMRPPLLALALGASLLAAGCFSFSGFTVPSPVDESRLQRAVAHNPDNLHAHFLLGRAHLEENRPAEARRHFQSAMDLDESFQEAWHGLGIALLDMGRDRAALTHYTRMADAFPQSATPREGRAAASLAMADFAAARQFANEALALNPSSATAHRYLGEADYADARYQEALSHWRRALELDPALRPRLGSMADDLELFLRRAGVGSDQLGPPAE